MINLELPKKFKPFVMQAHQVGLGMFRPISRKYDRAEHAYPKELDMLGAIMRGMGEGGELPGETAGPRLPPWSIASRVRRSRPDICAAPWQARHLVSMTVRAASSARTRPARQAKASHATGAHLGRLGTLTEVSIRRRFCRTPGWRLGLGRGGE